MTSPRDRLMKRWSRMWDAREIEYRDIGMLLTHDCNAAAEHHLDRARRIQAIMDRLMQRANAADTRPCEAIPLIGEPDAPDPFAMLNMLNELYTASTTYTAADLHAHTAARLVTRYHMADWTLGLTAPFAHAVKGRLTP